MVEVVYLDRPSLGGRGPLHQLHRDAERRQLHEGGRDVSQLPPVVLSDPGPVIDSVELDDARVLDTINNNSSKFPEEFSMEGSL